LAVALQQVPNGQYQWLRGGKLSLALMVAPRYSIVVRGQQCFFEPMAVSVMFIANGRSMFPWL